jgi:hypothetical protein
MDAPGQVLYLEEIIFSDIEVTTLPSVGRWAGLFDQRALTHGYERLRFPRFNLRRSLKPSSALKFGYENMKWMSMVAST